MSDPLQSSLVAVLKPQATFDQPTPLPAGGFVPFANLIQGLVQKQAPTDELAVESEAGPNSHFVVKNPISDGSFLAERGETREAPQAPNLANGDVAGSSIPIKIKFDFRVANTPKPLGFIAGGQPMASKVNDFPVEAALTSLSQSASLAESGMTEATSTQAPALERQQSERPSVALPYGLQEFGSSELTETEKPLSGAAVSQARPPTLMRADEAPNKAALLDQVNHETFRREGDQVPRLSSTSAPKIDIGAADTSVDLAIHPNASPTTRPDETGLLRVSSAPQGRALPLSLYATGDAPPYEVLGLHVREAPSARQTKTQDQAKQTAGLSMGREEIVETAAVVETLPIVNRSARSEVRYLPPVSNMPLGQALAIIQEPTSRRTLPVEQVFPETQAPLSGQNVTQSQAQQKSEVLTNIPASSKLLVPTAQSDTNYQIQVKATPLIAGDPAQTEAAHLPLDQRGLREKASGSLDLSTIGPKPISESVTTETLVRPHSSLTVAGRPSAAAIQGPVSASDTPLDRGIAESPESVGATDTTGASIATARLFQGLDLQDGNGVRLAGGAPASLERGPALFHPKEKTEPVPAARTSGTEPSGASPSTLSGFRSTATAPLDPLPASQPSGVHYDLAFARSAQSLVKIESHANDLPKSSVVNAIGKPEGSSALASSTVGIPMAANDAQLLNGGISLEILEEALLAPQGDPEPLAPVAVTFTGAIALKTNGQRLPYVPQPMSTASTDSQNVPLNEGVQGLGRITVPVSAAEIITRIMGKPEKLPKAAARTDDRGKPQQSHPSPALRPSQAAAPREPQVSDERNTPLPVDEIVKKATDLTVKKKGNLGSVTAQNIAAHAVLSPGQPIRDLGSAEGAATVAPPAIQGSPSAPISPSEWGKADLTQQNGQPANKTQAELRYAALAQLRALELGMGRTLVNLVPRGIGRLEIEILGDKEATAQVTIRVENTTLLQALREDRQAMAQALGFGDATRFNFEQSGGRHANPEQESMQLDHDVEATIDVFDEKVSAHVDTILDDQVNILT